MSATIADLAALIARHIPRPNPIAGATITADLGVVDGTPTVLVARGGETHRATYLPPYTVQLGNCFVARQGPELTAPLIVVTTNYQVPIAPAIGGGSTGSGLGYGPSSGAGAAPATDWAAAMTDPTNTDGSLFPLTLGQVAT